MSRNMILVIGYFGKMNNQIDGQTIRTNSIYNLIKERSDSEVIFFDTQSFKNNKLSILKMIFLICKSKVIFDIAAHGNLKYLFPLIFILCFFLKKKLNYVAVGGWLFDFIENMPIHKKLLMKTQNVFVQTENLCIKLKENNFTNVRLLNNFRLTNFQRKIVRNNRINKIVFMARIHEMKGVDVIFQLGHKLIEMGYTNIVIDLYGPIHHEYEKSFLKNLKNSSINYGGIVDPLNVYDVLENYDLMVFPTKYFTEGFPGSILDAYISGIPVIASDWMNAHEFIVDKCTGYIVEFNNPAAFIEKVIWLIENPDNLLLLDANIIQKSKQYSSDSAWSTLIENKAL
ncbi:glycosyltransferase [Acinetobacter sp. ANC 4945]|nr:glycosyltransferase [Acinetobacter amyesii]MCL6247804.1 glycosyltransferase [Acinetobacter amyesii]